MLRQTLIVGFIFFSLVNWTQAACIEPGPDDPNPTLDQLATAWAQAGQAVAELSKKTPAEDSNMKFLQEWVAGEPKRIQQARTFQDSDPWFVRWKRLSLIFAKIISEGGFYLHAPTEAYPQGSVRKKGSRCTPAFDINWAWNYIQK